MIRQYLLDVSIALLCSFAGYLLIRWTSEVPRHYRLRHLLTGAILLVWIQTALSVPGIANQVDHSLGQWTRCFGLVCGASLLYSAVLLPVFRLSGLHDTGAFDPKRRRLLRAGVGIAVAVPAALATFAIVRRTDLQFREVEVLVPNLPKDLQGLRIAQITDIHLGPFLDEGTLVRAIGMANETKPHLTFVTGDLISTKGDPLDNCIRHLAALRSDSGLWGCMGNHEGYAMAEDYTEEQGRRIGLRFLRHEAASLQFGSASINLVGVDYQRKRTPYLAGADAMIVPGAYNILLSHSPDVFGVSARQGFDLTVAGHTHGGQVTLEMIHPSLNMARFSTPWVHGLYERSGKSMYVSRGIGTIGLPARLGAPPEVTLIRLCAI